MRQIPHFKSIDAGSTDSDPHFLGSGECTLCREVQEQDLTVPMTARSQANIPLLIWTAYTAGGLKEGQGVRRHYQ